jgi:GR25 family glycosyltransferase involved in LPS biosynthesis
MLFCKEIWVITLNCTPERTDYTEKLLQNMNFKYRLFKFRKNKFPEKGCIESHIALYKEARKLDLDFITIVEDNICLSPNFNIDNYVQLDKIIKNKTNWDTICIGGFVAPSSRIIKQTEYNRLYKSNNCHGTSAYIISRKGYNRAIKDFDSKKINKPIDVYLSSLNQYIYKPLIFYHRIIPSTINPRLNLIRKFWFNKNIFKIAEFLFFQNKLSWTLLILILISLITLCCIFIISLRSIL